MTNSALPQTIISSIRLDIQNIPAEFDDEIHAVMRRQQSAKRVAYNRFQEGGEEAKIYRNLCDIFPKLTAWDVNAAIETAKAVRKSQTALIPSRIEYLTNKIERLKKKKNPKPEIVKYIAKLETSLVEF